MAVANKQVEEICDVILSVIDLDTAMQLVAKLSKVEAFRRNKSYRETIARLAEALGGK